MSREKWAITFDGPDSRNNLMVSLSVVLSDGVGGKAARLAPGCRKPQKTK